MLGACGETTSCWSVSGSGSSTTRVPVRRARAGRSSIAVMLTAMTLRAIPRMVRIHASTASEPTAHSSPITTRATDVR